jgi:hypothetical protein
MRISRKSLGNDKGLKPTAKFKSRYAAKEDCKSPSNLNIHLQTALNFDFGNDTADCAIRTRRVGFRALPQRRKQSQQLSEQPIHGRAALIRHAKIKAGRE